MMFDADQNSSVAVIGMSGRFPGAKNLAQFWANVSEGVESISFFSDEELRRVGVDPAVRSDANYVGAGGILPDIDLFDAAFFGFNPREAEIMDPQQRLFLECAWEAFENAGYDPGRYAGSIGVYAGTGISTYFFNLYQNDELVNLVGGHQIMIGNDKDHLTTHVSYKLNLRGPSVTVQTACSTSLVAVAVACHSLLDYGCDMALAGGASIAIPQGRGYMYREGGIASPDGHCRAFDADARGTVAGNGVGIVLLKRLGDAIADGDAIRAVILGSAINNDGSQKVGYTAPSIDGQAEVIATALAVSAVEASDIGYVEAHGTGTPLGDPIEVAALQQAFRGVRRPGTCALGSVKSNIGHLDTAAGIAGFIKTVLALEHRTIPPSLHFRTANPKLQLDRTPFHVPIRAFEWESNGQPRRAGVSSFGIGGTNAHVVLEQPPARGPSGPSRAFQLFAVSAPTSSGLEALTRLYANELKAQHDVPLADIAFTLLTGRKAFRHRRALVCRDMQEAVSLLRERPSSRVREGAPEPRHRPIVFMFSGQGSQYAGMAAGLYRQEPVFRQHMDECLAVLNQQGDVDFSSLLGCRGAVPSNADAQLSRTATTQPALFAVEYALARLWISWGVRPDHMIGHSIGEYVAACVAGVFSMPDAVRLVSLRGRLMQSLPEGAMLAVPLSEQEAVQLLHDDLSLAAVNLPAQCVISGPTRQIDDAATALSLRGVEGVRLRTSHAFHSRMMDSISDTFVDAIRKIDLQAPALPFISNVTGDWITSAQATDPCYWGRHLRDTVRFDAGLARALHEPDCVLFEIGPSRTLSALARQHPRTASQTVIIDSLPDRRHREDDGQHVLDALARAWAAGVPVDWNAFFLAEQRLRVPLPTYPFERKRFWIDPPAGTAQKVEGHPATGRNENVSSWFYVPTWTRSEASASVPVHDPRSWLIFDDGTIGAAIATRLRFAGHAVTRVMPGPTFQRVAEHEYTVRSDHGADYETLVDQLRTSGERLGDILHCWSAAEGPVPFDAAQRQGFSSFLHFVRAWSNSALAQPVTISVLTRGAQQVLGADVVDPSRATILGAAKVVPQEYPGIRVRTLDVEGAWGPSMLQAMLDECLAPVTEPTIAYRGGSRWVQEFAPAPWLMMAARPSLLKIRGVYLITGGFGNIGLTLAEFLASRYDARLALLSRTALPSRDEWDRWIAGHDAADRLSSRIMAVRALEALGADVLTVAADVADATALKNAIAQTELRFGALNGVIHTAGTMAAAAFRPVGATDSSVADQHFGPKVVGTRNLADALRGRPLDFCMLTSSLSSLLGGLDFAAYAAANAYLDAFAQQQRADSPDVPWIVVNWDGWQFDAHAHSRSEFFVTPAEGAEAFRRVLTAPPARQIAVSSGDLNARLRRWVRLSEAAPRATSAEAVTPVHERPAVPTAYATPRNAAEQVIAEVWQGVLGVNRVGIHDNFFELGGHSLLAIQLISRVRDLFQAAIALTALFEHPTVAELAQHIDDVTGSADDRMRELDHMLDFVEQLSPDQVQALLNEQPGS